MTNSEINEALGYDEIEGLKNPKGEDLGKVQVPHLPGFTAIRLQKRVLKKFMDVAKMGDVIPKAAEGEDLDPAAMGVFFEQVFDDEGIQLQIDVLLAAFGGTVAELELRFDLNSLNKLFAHILKRNFQIQDLIGSFMSRFADVFGVTPDNQAPPTESPPES